MLRRGIDGKPPIRALTLITGEMFIFMVSIPEAIARVERTGILAARIFVGAMLRIAGCLPSVSTT
jgi:hypothetical protein